MLNRLKSVTTNIFLPDMQFKNSIDAALHLTEMSLVNNRAGRQKD